MASGFIPGAISLDDVCDVRNLTYRIREAHYILLMLMEDHMEGRADTHSLYVLIVSLLGTVISLPVVWYFTETAHAASGLVA